MSFLRRATIKIIHLKDLGFFVCFFAHDLGYFVRCYPSLFCHQNPVQRKEVRGEAGWMMEGAVRLLDTGDARRGCWAVLQGYRTNGTCLAADAENRGTYSTQPPV